MSLERPTPGSPPEHELAGAVGWAEVAAARELLDGVAHRTPVATSRALDRRLGAEVFCKCENLQRVGAFKFRGAYNAISRLGDEGRRRGVVTFSSGNHAQAVALAGSLLGVETTIVMPSTAPRAKLEATRGYGARVVEHDPAKIDRREVAARLEAELGAIVVPPFDHPHVIAGQGTAAAELLEDTGPLDLLIAPVGGGGLLSGTAVAAGELAPGCRVVGVEPTAGDDAARSLETGRLQVVEHPRTIADGTATPSLGRYTFAILSARAERIVTVSEEAIREAVRFCFYRFKLVVEPSGSLGLAALFSGAVEPRGRIGVILSGGNVDGERMAEILTGRRPG